MPWGLLEGPLLVQDSLLAELLELPLCFLVIRVETFDPRRGGGYRLLGTALPIASRRARALTTRRARAVPPGRACTDFAVRTYNIRAAMRPLLGSFRVGGYV